MMANEDFRHKIDNNYSFEVPIGKALVKAEKILAIDSNFLLFIFGFMVFLSYIVSNQIIQNSIDNK